MEPMLVALACLSLNVYHEARGEPDVGQLAVAYVTLNRARGRGTDVCAVVAEPYQFSWTTGGIVMRKEGWTLMPHMVPTDLKALEKAVRIARMAMNRQVADPTQGALFYHADYVSPYWKNSMRQIGTIGQHIFYHDESVAHLRAGEDVRLD
jgi:spore germination cell wall hydrolase CwlJ-like protein